MLACRAELFGSAASHAKSQLCSAAMGTMSRVILPVRGAVEENLWCQGCRRENLGCAWRRCHCPCLFHRRLRRRHRRRHRRRRRDDLKHFLISLGQRWSNNGHYVHRLWPFKITLPIPRPVADTSLLPSLGSLASHLSALRARDFSYSTSARCQVCRAEKIALASPRNVTATRPKFRSHSHSTLPLDLLLPVSVGNWSAL